MCYMNIYRYILRPTASAEGSVMSLIVATNITKDYQTGDVTVRALKGLSFEIEPASFVSFVGPSGSGKTTLLNLIGCLDKPTDGKLMVAATEVLHLDRKQSASFRGNNIGFIFQDFNLIPVLTVYENIEYPLLMVQNMPTAERNQRVNALLTAVGMTDQKDKFPDQISGGQKQRVAVARALVTNPKLVLADEPTANLDHKTAYMVIELMRKMRDEFGTTFIFSTHDQKIVGEAEIIFTIEDGEPKVNKHKGGGGNGESLQNSDKKSLEVQEENIAHRFTDRNRCGPCSCIHFRFRIVQEHDDRGDYRLDDRTYAGASERVCRIHRDPSPELESQGRRRRPA